MSPPRKAPRLYDFQGSWRNCVECRVHVRDGSVDRMFGGEMLT